jgi:hypothetical protein
MKDTIQWIFFLTDNQRLVHNLTEKDENIDDDNELFEHFNAKNNDWIGLFAGETWQFVDSKFVKAAIRHIPSITDREQQASQSGPAPQSIALGNYGNPPVPERTMDQVPSLPPS